MRPFLFSKSSAANQALAKKNHSTQFIAGGTNLVDLMKKHIANPESLVDISSVLPNKVENTAKGISIGAMMRKLVHVAFGVLKSGRKFDPELHVACVK